ncbi:unnamed protein product [Heligmosomoides polygyrus]|uniref:Secreted protein n=1 Tax=Heligmosomoides polygyrus TaxID=6339 RepID=A0A183GFC1_HELPZ|nr:unnamed protein product [Heligmosomoides polygyrus]
MRFRILKNSFTISVTCPITETAMTAVTIFRSPNVVIEITCDNESVFWRHLCCLLIKQGSKLVLGSLESLRREEMIHSLFSSDNDLHQAVTETLHTCLQQDHLVSYTAHKSIRLRSSVSTNQGQAWGWIFAENLRPHPSQSGSGTTSTLV